MSSRGRSQTQSTASPRRPATTPEGREQQLIAAAYDLAEKRIEEGTASAQEITHFLKLGSSRERLEQTRLENENELTRSKIGQIESQGRIEELYAAAISAISLYQGRPAVGPEDDYDD
jgi:hypothetical protein